MINKQDKDNDALIQGKAEIKRLFLRKRNRMELQINKKYDAEKKMYEEAIKKCEEVKKLKLRELHDKIEEEEIELELIVKRAKGKISKNQ